MTPLRFHEKKPKAPEIGDCWFVEKHPGRKWTAVKVGPSDIHHIVYVELLAGWVVTGGISPVVCDLHVRPSIHLYKGRGKPMEWHGWIEDGCVKEFVQPPGHT